ncbi:hypothetical protein ACFL1R_02640 [Candidatus Latescibacterota bacterium]
MDTIKTLCYLLFILFTVQYSLHADLQPEQIESTYPVESRPLAPPLHGGPIRILFIGRHDTIVRISAELSARLEYVVDLHPTESYTRLGTPEATMYSTPKTSSDALIKKRFSGLFNELWDVIWLDFELASLPPEMKESLLDHVSRGTGLVYIGEKKELRSFTTKGEVDEKPLKAVVSRTVKTECAGKRDGGIMVSIPPASEIKNYMDAGDYYSSAVNAILFVSGHQNQIGTFVTELKLPKTVEQEAMTLMSYRVDIEHRKSPQPMNVHQRYWNEKGEMVFESDDVFNIQSGRSFIQLDYPLLPIGIFSVEISLSGSEGVRAFGRKSFTVKAGEHITGIKLWSKSISEGDVIAGTAKLSAELEEGMYLLGELRDSWGRILKIINLEVVIKRNYANFSFLVKHQAGQVLTVCIHFYKNNNLVHSYETPVIVKKPYNPYTFSLVVCDNNPTDFLSKETYKYFRIYGADGFDIDITGFNNPGSAFGRALAAVQYGTMVIPRFTFYPGSSSDERTFLNEQLYAFIDTLSHTNPPAYVIEYASLTKEGESSVFLPDSVEQSLLRSFQELIAHSGTPVKVITGFPFSGGSLQGFEIYRTMDEKVPFDNDRTDRTNVMDDRALLPPLYSFSSHEDLTGLFIRGNSYNPGQESLYRAIPWYCLFSGMNSIWWKEQWKVPEDNAAPPTFVSPAFSIVAEQIREIRSGIDLLLLGSTGQVEDGKGSTVAVLDTKGKPAPLVHATVISDSGNEYIGILTDPGIETVFNGKNCEYFVKLTKNGTLSYVYDVIDKTFLGAVDRFPVKLSPGSANLFALIPYRVQRLELKLEKSIIRGGTNLSYKVSVIPHEKESKPGRHVIRISVIDPDGIERSYFTSVHDAVKGELAGTIRLALNEPEGRWRLVALDVVTGRKTERTFMIVP